MLRSAVVGDAQLSESVAEQLLEDGVQSREEQHEVGGRDDARHGVVERGDVSRDERAEAVAGHGRAHLVRGERVAERALDDRDQLAVDLVDVLGVELRQLLELLVRRDRRDRRGRLRDESEEKGSGEGEGSTWS